MEFNELQQMVARVDDSAGDHALWIDNDNVVHLDLMPCDMNDLKKIIRIFDQNSGYLGEIPAGYELNMNVIYTQVLDSEKATD